MFSSSVHAFPSQPPPPRLSDNWASAVSSVPHLQPLELVRAATDSLPPSAAQLRASGAIEPLPPRLHFPSLNSLLNLSSSRQSSMALKPLTSVLTALATPPRCSPGPYKRRAPSLSFTAPLPAHIFLSPRSGLPLTERRHHRALTIIACPPRCRSSPGEALIELLVRSSLCCAPAGELWRTGATGGRAPVSTPPGPLSAPASVHGGPSAPGRSSETWTQSTDLSVGN
jgi:hypothetical protein